MTDRYPFPDEFSPIGSSAYYAIRFAPPGRRSFLSLANAFYRTVRNIPVTCSDPGVAAEKLNWWRLEIERSRESRAQHPMAISMGALQAQYSLPTHYFEPFFRAVGQEIGTIEIESDNDLERHCRDTGALFADLNALIGGSDEAQRRSARELGSFLRMVEIIRDLGFDLRRNRCFIPAERLRQHQLSPAQLLHIEESVQLQSLLCSITGFQRQHYQKTVQAIHRRDGLGPLLSLTAMAEQVLKIIDADGYRRLVHQRTSLTPLHKLWISWRCQRRIRSARNTSRSTNV